MQHNDCMEEPELCRLYSSKFFFLYSIGSSGENDEDEEHDLERIDIPRSLLDIRKYCATLGHKGKPRPTFYLFLSINFNL